MFVARFSNCIEDDIARGWSAHMSTDMWKTVEIAANFLSDLLSPEIVEAAPIEREKAAKRAANWRLKFAAC